MIFLTVGTLYPFDRLVRAVDDAVAAGLIDDEVFAQVGRGGVRPRHMKWAEALDRDAFLDCVARSRAIIGHAGTGTIFAGIEAGKPVLVMPRLRRYGEGVNDHQVGTGKKFADQGQILFARDESELPRRIRELDSFVAKPRQIKREPVIERVRSFLDGLA